MFSVLEPCRTFSLVWKEHKTFVRPATRKCLHLYYYFMDRQLGLIHVKLQTWFPFPIQVYVNGHEWLARRLDRHGLKYVKADNAFLRVDDLARAQRLADGFASLDWVHVLGCYARQINPLLRGLLAPMQMTRLLRRFHAYGLIARIPHSRRWRVSFSGRRIMAAAIKLRDVAYPGLYAAAA